MNSSPLFHLQSFMRVRGRLLTYLFKSFADVPFTECGVETQSFLEASDGLIQMFGTLVLPFLFLVFQLFNGFVQRGRV